MQLYESKLYEMVLSCTVIQISVWWRNLTKFSDRYPLSATNYYCGELFVHDFFLMVVSDLNILAPDKA